MNKGDLDNISPNDIERIGACAEQNANDCNFDFGELCKFCSVWIDKNVPRNCPWVRKI